MKCSVSVLGADAAFRMEGVQKIRFDICFLAFPTGHQAPCQHKGVRNRGGGLEAHIHILQELLQDLVCSSGNPRSPMTNRYGWHSLLTL